MDKFFTLILISMLVFGVFLDVAGQGKGATPKDAAYYHRIEKEYTSKARNVLDAKGYKNSGITMTHLLDEDGARTFIVRLHHERLDKVSKESRREILEALTSIDFAGGEVLYEII